MKLKMSALSSSTTKTQILYKSTKETNPTLKCPKHLNFQVFLYSFSQGKIASINQTYLTLKCPITFQVRLYSFSQGYNYINI